MNDTETLAEMISALRPEGHPTGGKGTVSWGAPGHVRLCGCRIHGSLSVQDKRCLPMTRDGA